MAWYRKVDIPYPTTPYEFHLHGLCDLQIGSTSTSMSIIKSRIAEIVDDPVDSAIIIPGDIEDEDRPSTRSLRRSAFSEREEVIQRDAQKHMAWIDKDIIPLLLPLQKTKFGIVGILAGHHWTQIPPVLNSVQYICQELTRLSNKKVEYMGEMSCFLDLRFKSKNKSIKKIVHVQHGDGGGQTKSAALNKLDRTTQSFIADAYIRAHDCQIVASKFDQLFPKEVRGENSQPAMLSKTGAMLNLGAATRGYEMSKGAPSYVERGMMRPTSMGWGTIKFQLRRAWTWEDPDKNLKIDMKIEI